MIKERYWRATLLVLALCATPAGVRAQDLAGRSRLDLRLATRLASRVSTSSAGVVKSTEAGGVLGSLGIAHWFQEDLALTVTASLLGAKVEESNAGGGGWKSRKAFSVPLLMGLRRFIPPRVGSSRWRPWASLEAGPIIGFELASSRDNYGGGSQNAVGTRVALAGRGGIGLDARLGKIVTVSGSAGYLLIPGFIDGGGDQNNHEGLDVGFAVGVLVK